jgi:hypothetical protein
MPRQTIPHQDPGPRRPRLLGTHPALQLKLSAGLATGKEVDQRWCENLVRHSVPLAGQTPMQAFGQRAGHCVGHADEVVAASRAVEHKGRHRCVG